MATRKDLTWRDVRVGVFIATGIAILVFIILIVGTNTKKFSSKFTLYTYVPNVLSLNPGAFITVSGIKAGTVGDFEFEERAGEYGVRMSLFVEKKYQHWVTESSVARIRTLGILGDKYIEISLGTANERVLQDGDFIPTEVPFDFEAILPKAEEMLNTLPKIISSLDQVLAKINAGQGTLGRLVNDSLMGADLARASSSLADLSQSMNKKTGSLGKFINEPQAYDHLVKLMRDLDSLVTHVRSGQGSLGKFVTDSTLYANLASASQRADSAMAALNSTKGTAGRLLNDDRVYTRLDSLLDELNKIIKDMKKYPQKYFKIEVF